MSSLSNEQAEPKWRPISAIERRVIGVLVEKAKTTPEQYPLSISALRTGSNQKSNRFPMMNLDAEKVEDTVDRLREMGLVTELQSSGRVLKYRHLAYDWFGVDKTELAVMTELLLRGAQTVGELRGRASRMERIADLAQLRPILASLEAKELVLPLTPEGRGQVVAHALYLPQELERIRSQYVGHARQQADATREGDEASQQRPPQRPMSNVATTSTPSPTAEAIPPETIQALREEVAELRSQVSELRGELEQLATDCRRGFDEISELREALGG